MGFSVNVLLYGDHCDLAVRCLDSIVRTADWSLIEDIRIGCNEVAIATEAYIQALAARVPVPVYRVAERDGRNVYKYPLMRCMFYEAGSVRPETRFMWFDDDSYIRPETQSNWWKALHISAASHTLIGSRFSMMFEGNQKLAIRHQPWYTGRPWQHDRYANEAMLFAQGAWWIADPAFLRKWDYPFRALEHNGGDTLLGELCYQQRAPFLDWHTGVAINVNPEGVESGPGHRGKRTARLWRIYPAPTEDGDHCNFDLCVELLNTPQSGGM